LFSGIKLVEVCHLSQSSLVLVDNKNLVLHLQHWTKNQWHICSSTESTLLWMDEKGSSFCLRTSSWDTQFEVTYCSNLRPLFVVN